VHLGEEQGEAGRRPLLHALRVVLGRNARVAHALRHRRLKIPLYLLQLRLAQGGWPVLYGRRPVSREQLQPLHLGRPLLAKCRAPPSPRLIAAVVLHLGVAEFPLRRLAYAVPGCRVRAQ
jgi:hypothetical protein